MITGMKTIKIKEYWLIDHTGEGGCRVYPGEGEEIWGIPYQFHADQSYPFIEHIVNGKLIKTVNALDVSEITFAE